MSVPLVTTAVSGLFALLVFVRFLQKRRPYQLVWSVGLLMFAVAAFAGFLARSGGATDNEYRVFYLFGAILNVAWLALGTLYLLVPRRVANVALGSVALLSAVSLYAVLASSVDVSAAVDTGRGFQESPLPRILAGVGSGVGSLVLIGGALWSAWVFFRRRHEGKRALANVIIAAGVLVAAAGGTVAFTGTSGVLETTNLVGIALIFVGFLIA